MTKNNKKETVKIQITISKYLNDWLDNISNYVGKTKEEMIEESLDTYKRKMNFSLATNQIVKEMRNK